MDYRLQSQINIVVLCHTLVSKVSVGKCVGSENLSKVFGMRYFLGCDLNVIVDVKCLYKNSEIKCNLTNIFEQVLILHLFYFCVLKIKVCPHISECVLYVTY